MNGVPVSRRHHGSIRGPRRTDPPPGASPGGPFDIHPPTTNPICSSRSAAHSASHTRCRCWRWRVRCWPPPIPARATSWLPPVGGNPRTDPIATNCSPRSSRSVARRPQRLNHAAPGDAEVRRLDQARADRRPARTVAVTRPAAHLARSMLGAGAYEATSTAVRSSRRLADGPSPRRRSERIRTLR
jgi:hypothetical protein